MSFSRPAAGFSFLSILAVLVILGFMYFVYVSYGTLDKRPTQSLIEASTGAEGMACQANRQAVEKTLLNWKARNPGRELSLIELKKTGITVPSCPKGGEFTLRQGTVICSTHSSR
jgi:hypothetical protein